MQSSIYMWAYTGENNFKPTYIYYCAGGTDRDLAVTQFTKNLCHIQYYRVLNIIDLKLYNVL